MAFLTAGGVEMPCPVSLKVNDEIIWSENTGRSSTGTMVGDVVTEKQDVEIAWGILTAAEAAKIKKYMVAGFFTVAFPTLGISFTGYRGTLSKELLGTLTDGVTYYKSASVKLVEQ